MNTELKKQIFTSFVNAMQDENYSVWVDYADRINVSRRLKENDVVITLAFFGDVRDNKHSPCNKLLAVENLENCDIKYHLGERRRVTLSINVHSNLKNEPAMDIVDHFINKAMVWYLKDLSKIVEIVYATEVKDLSFIDGIARKQFDVTVRYTVEYEEVVPSIQTVRGMIDVVDMEGEERRFEIHTDPNG